MVQRHYKGLFKEALLQFVTEPCPVLAMLEWVAEHIMQIEAEARVGAEKRKHSRVRKTHFSGRWVRRMDTRLGTIYLYVRRSGRAVKSRSSSPRGSGRSWP